MRIIAHRSGPTVFPEQTIASARCALENGADFVEIDVRFTSDKAIAICHDPNAKRVFGADKQICDMTKCEYLALRHADAPEYPSHLFEDYLKCGIAPLLIHIKEDQVIPQLLEQIMQYGYLDKVVLGVGTLDAVHISREIAPEVKILSFMPKPELIEAFADAGVDYIRLWEGWMNPETVKQVKATGKELWIMTRAEGDYDAGVTTAEGLKKILSYDVDGILINDINELKAIL